MRVFVQWVLSGFFSKLSTLSHLFQNIFLSEKTYDIRLLWVWLPAKSPLSLQYLITSPKNDTNVGNCSLKSCAYCNPFFSTRRTTKSEQGFWPSRTMKTFLHEYSCIFSKTSAVYTGSARLPQISDFLSRTFILETRSHRSYADVRRQVTHVAWLRVFLTPPPQHYLTLISPLHQTAELCSWSNLTRITTLAVLLMWVRWYSLCWSSGSAQAQACPGLPYKNPRIVWYNSKNCFEK